MELLTPKHWHDYELIDCGDFEKLERFGSYVMIRPEPQAVWSRKLSLHEWKHAAHVRFIPKGSASGDWSKLKDMPDRWNVSYNISGVLPKLSFRLALTSFKHVGLFPEQSENWEFIFNSVKKLKTPHAKVLNMFAYTGGASLAARAAGADVIHLDSIRQVVTWANENMELSGLNNIRWLVEDALTFVRREIKRGKKYQGIILDPPAYGQGTNGERWKLEDNISEMMKLVGELLDEEEHFLVLNTYSLGFSSLIIENILDSCLPKNSKTLTGEVYLQATSGVKLPLGVFGQSHTF